MYVCGVAEGRTADGCRGNMSDGFEEEKIGDQDDFDQQDYVCGDDDKQADDVHDPNEI